MIEFGEIEKKYIRISIKVYENLKYVIFFFEIFDVYFYWVLCMWYKKLYKYIKFVMKEKYLNVYNERKFFFFKFIMVIK